MSVEHVLQAVSPTSRIIVPVAMLRCNKKCTVELCKVCYGSNDVKVYNSFFFFFFPRRNKGTFMSDFWDAYEADLCKEDAVQGPKNMVVYNVFIVSKLLLIIMHKMQWNQRFLLPHAQLLHQSHNV